MIIAIEIALSIKKNLSNLTVALVFVSKLTIGGFIPKWVLQKRALDFYSYLGQGLGFCYL